MFDKRVNKIFFGLILVLFFYSINRLKVINAVESKDYEFTQHSNHISFLLARCPETKPVRECRGGDGGRNFRTGITIMSPPDGGNLLETKPVFSWLAPNLSDVQEYTVTLELSGEIVWQSQVTSSTQLEYPENEEPLEFAKYYTLTVKTRNRERSESESVGFKILDEATIQEVQNQIQTIKNKNFSPDREVLEIARLYQEPQYNLLDAAVRELNKAVDNNVKTAEIHLMLGELYEFEVKAYSFAENSYRNALNLAENQGNLTLKAKAQESLGKVLTLSPTREQEAEAMQQEGLKFLESAYHDYQAVNEQEQAALVAEWLGETYKFLDNRDEAIHWYRLAKEGYQTLRHDRLETVEEELRKLEL